jgi:hypothetical protein
MKISSAQEIYDLRPQTGFRLAACEVIVALRRIRLAQNAVLESFVMQKYATFEEVVTPIESGVRAADHCY